MDGEPPADRGHSRGAHDREPDHPGAVQERKSRGAENPSQFVQVQGDVHPGHCPEGLR